MKVAFKLLLSYLLASFLMTVLSVVLDPPHAHFPIAVVLLFSPLVPWITLRDFFTAGIEWEKLLAMGVFVLVFGCAAWLAVRSPSKKNVLSGSEPRKSSNNIQ